MDLYCNTTNASQVNSDKETFTSEHFQNSFYRTTTLDVSGNTSTQLYNDSRYQTTETMPKDTNGRVSSGPDIEEMLQNSMKSIGNATEYFVSYLGQNYQAFSRFFELEILSSVVIMGLILNFAAVCYICRDKSRPHNVKIAILLCILMDEIYLCFLLCLTFISCIYTDSTNLETLNYFTCFFGYMLFIRSWTFHLILYDTQKALELIRYFDQNTLKDQDSKDCFNPDLRINARFMILPAIAGAVYFSLYLPPMRMMLNSVHVHSMCNVPVKNYWDLNDMSLPYSRDVFYLCIYLFPYLAGIYIAPLMLYSYRNKRIIDTLRRIHERRKFNVTIPEERIIHFASYLSCSACLWVTCESVKMTPLSLYATDFIHPFIRRGKYFLMYFNCLANLAVVVKSSSNIFLLILLNANFRRMLKDRTSQVKITILRISKNFKLRVLQCLRSRIDHL